MVAVHGHVGMHLSTLKFMNNPSAKILVLQFYIDTHKKIN